MEVKVLENTKHKLVVDFPGAETHTLFNLLAHQLRDDKEVKVGGYYIEHPLLNVPRLVVETKGKSPVKAVEDSLKAIHKLNDTFLKAVEKAIK
ncbi:DNA-directed RNA polymerase subunit L [Candidatus Woesearchaeota archaeon]|nr:DNA-directed RNA polymerase subunit L [Candidatus Woesearchaeota archaeon]